MVTRAAFALLVIAVANGFAAPSRALGTGPVGLAAAEVPAADSADQDSLSLERALQLRDQDRLSDSVRILEELCRRNPTDMNLGRLYAETLAWDDRLGAARSQYAWMAARGDSTSLLGVAMTDSWSGDLARGADEYQGLMGNANLRPRAQLGLARVRLWQGHYAEAGRLLGASKLQQTVEGRRLSRDLDDERSVRAIAAGRFESDSDGNHFTLGQVGSSTMLWRDFRFEALLGGGNTRGGPMEYRLLRGEFGLDGPIGGMWSTGLRAGLERRDPRRGASAAADLQRTDRGFGAAYLRADAGSWMATITGERKHLSDNPALIASDIGLTSVDLGLSWIPRRWFRADAGGAFASFSDSNRRFSQYLAVQGKIVEIRPTPAFGVIHRRMQNQHGGPRAYFSPKDYSATEAFVSLEQNLWARHLYYLVRSSLGAQRIGSQDLDTILGALLSIEARPTRSLRISLSAGHTEAGAQSPSGYDLNRAILRASILF